MRRVADQTEPVALAEAASWWTTILLADAGSHPAHGQRYVASHRPFVL